MSDERTFILNWAEPTEEDEIGKRLIKRSTSNTIESCTVDDFSEALDDLFKLVSEDEFDAVVSIKLKKRRKERGADTE